MFERFTERARRVVVLSQEEAGHLGHDWIGTEHLLLGLLREEEGLGGRVLRSFGITLPWARDRIEEVIGIVHREPTGHVPFTPRAKKVLELALREALRLGHSGIGTEHLLLGLVREGEGMAVQLLRGHGTDPSGVRQAVLDRVGGAEAGAPGATDVAALAREPLDFIGVLAVVAVAFAAETPAADRAAVLEDGDALVTRLNGARDRDPQIAWTDVRLVGVRFTRPDHAVVEALLVRTPDLVGLSITATGGRDGWTVTRRSFCQLLDALGAPCD